MSTPSDTSTVGAANEDGIDRLSRMAGEAAADAAADPCGPSRWMRLVDRRARLARRERRRMIALGSVIVLLLGLAGERLWRARTVDVAYQVEGQAAIGEGGYVHDVGGAGARLQFSEGTVVELASG